MFGKVAMPTACDVAILQARVRRLHAKDTRLWPITLSPAVLASTSAEGKSWSVVPSRVGGDCVATDV